MKALSTSRRRSDIPPSRRERDLIGTFLGWMGALGSGTVALLLLHVPQHESEPSAAQLPDVPHTAPDRVTPEG